MGELVVHPPVVDWDLVYLGFIPLGLKGRVHHHWRRPTVALRHGLGVSAIDAHIAGTHAYMVNRRGVARLLRHALPLEVHVDMFFILAHRTGRIRAFMVLPSLADQRVDGVKFISHKHVLRNYKTMLPDYSLRSVALMTLVILVSCWLGIVWYHRTQSRKENYA